MSAPQICISTESARIALVTIEDAIKNTDRLLGEGRQWMRTPAENDTLKTGRAGFAAALQEINNALDII